MKIISWNMAHRAASWRYLAETDADIALVQEAGTPPIDVGDCIKVDSAPWRTPGFGMNRGWRTAVVQLSATPKVEWVSTAAIEHARPDQLAVSRIGTLAAATVSADDIEPFCAVSMYAAWESPHDSTGSNWVYADGSVHRLISDLSALIGQQRGHRLLVAGDFNILNGYGESGSAYWGSRYSTAFRRMESLGLEFVGPQSPDGRIATPWPDELPTGSKNVPTFHTNRQKPITATRQLDFVFASHSLADQLKVRALNDPDDWGPSDHCRVEIEIG